MKWLFTILAFLAAPALLLAPALAQQDPLDDETPRQINADFTPAYMVGDYITALRVFGDVDALPADSPVYFIWQQFRPSLDGFVARWQAQSQREALPPDEVSRLANLERRGAIATIVARAADTRIVIVNESHDNPRDRAFVMELAEALRPLGFTHYAAEALTNCCQPDQTTAPIDAVRQRQHAEFGDGFYLSDPTFSFLLHRILKAGYQPIAYEWIRDPDERPETREESITLRETAQASNLAAALVEAGPDAKFLIHVGYSHAAEMPFPDGLEWMASRLKSLTGIDPLTINQTDLSEYSMPREHAAIGMEPESASVVIFENGEPAKIGFNAELMDLQVVHPPIFELGGRPDWLARTGRTALQLEAEIVPVEGVRLVQVFLPDTGEYAVPIDQVLIEPEDEAPVVYVPADGQYRLEVLEG